jgi:RNA polymerase-binding transcription factor DksA
MNDAFLAEQKKKLLEEKKRIENQLSTRSKKSTHEADEREAQYTDYGDTVEDNAAEVAAYDVTVNVEKTLEEQLERVNAALQRIGNGTYGRDEKSGQPIGEERLRANPTATREVEEE